MHPLDPLGNFKRQVSKLVGIDLGAYKDVQMDRRISSMISRAGLEDPETYLRLLQTDRSLLDEFVAGLTINVSEWFRDSEKFEFLEEEVLPELLRQFGGALRIWSAGCSVGAEIYSMALILAQRRLLSACELLGTDIDENALEIARSARFESHHLKGLPQALIEQNFAPEPPDTWRLHPDLAKYVRFDRHDLLKEPPPLACHLVLCRNVAIYFNEAGKLAVHRTLAKALLSGGMLFVGSTERIVGYQDLGFEATRSFFYRKV